MRLSVKSLAIAVGLLWGGVILFVGLINLAFPAYGIDFLHVVSSIYPWFQASHTIADVGIGTADGIIDGAIAGLILAWLYNFVTGS